MSESLRKALTRGPDCPPLEDLIDAPAAFENHVADCPACRAELTLFRNFEAGDIAPDEQQAVRYIVGKLAPARRPFWQRFFAPSWFTPKMLGGMALAAAALLVAIGLSSQWRIRQTAPPVTGDLTLRGAVVRITSPTGDLNQLPPAVTWQPVPGAASYAVTFQEVDGTVIFYKNITSSPLTLPESVNKLLVPGKRVLLEVVANDRAGMPVARSGLLGVRLQSH